MERITKKSIIKDASSIVEQNLGNISHDLLYYLVTGFGLSIKDIQSLCLVNKRFQKICKDKNVWKQVFVKKFNSTNDPSLNNLWDSIECEGFIKIVAFALRKELLESDNMHDTIWLVKDKLGFKFYRHESSETRGRVKLDPAVEILQRNSKEDNVWKQVTGSVKDLAGQYNLSLLLDAKFKLQKDLVFMLCRLLNDGYTFYSHFGEKPPSILTEACITCGETRNLLQCSGSCLQIYCSAECRIMNHQRDCKF